MRIIAPQHGAIIPERLASFMIEKLRDLDCGIYLFARENTDMMRLSRLNQTLREITQTMLLYRDFRDIAERLFRVVQRNLPAQRIDYHALLQDGTILTLSDETRFSGLLGSAPPELERLLGKTRAQWIEAHRNDPALADHRMHADAFCSREQGGEVHTLILPLFSPQEERMEAAALLHLGAGVVITPEVEQVILQIAMPLQVALEREVIYRTIEAERKKAYQGSIRDPLTGLFNRLYMLDTLERHCNIHDRDETSPLAAVMIDLDHFKAVNDQYGHGAGDEVLRQMAHLLRENVRESDIPVRDGGEEFILFLVGASAFGAADQGERIRVAVEQHGFVVGDGRRLPITASVGVATRERYESLDALIRRADRALYRAKEGGRNRVELAPTTNQRL